jgi:hypothetical protein
LLFVVGYASKCLQVVSAIAANAWCDLQQSSTEAVRDGALDVMLIEVKVTPHRSSISMFVKNSIF